MRLAIRSFIEIIVHRANLRRAIAVGLFFRGGHFAQRARQIRHVDHLARLGNASRWGNKICSDVGHSAIIRWNCSESCEKISVAGNPSASSIAGAATWAKRSRPEFFEREQHSVHHPGRDRRADALPGIGGRRSPACSHGSTGRC